MSKRIALIHATPVAMQPVRDAFEHGWPEVETVNLLDDALSHDLARSGTLDKAMMQRFDWLGSYAIQIGADAMAALAAGDGSTHDRLIAAAAPQLAHCDVIMLAQFSMAQAQDAVQQAVDRPILTSPASAVCKLKVVLGWT